MACVQRFAAHREDVALSSVARGLITRGLAGLVALGALSGIAPRIVLAEIKANQVEQSSSVPGHTKMDVLRAPLSFEPNRGQTDGRVKFVSRGDGYALFLTSKEAVFKLRRGGSDRSKPGLANPSQEREPSILRMELLGGNGAAQVSGADPLAGTANYFLGSDPAKWRTSLPTYGKVKYQSLYPGVDAVFYGNQRELEYDFNVAPGADPSQIALRFSGSQPKLNADGDIMLWLDGQEIVLHKPVLYQGSGSTRKTVEGAYTVAANQVRFRVGPYDHSQALVIDPVLTYLTYLGGSALDNIGSVTGQFPFNNGSNPAQALGVDSAGNVYVTGYTSSIDFPLQNAYDSANKSIAPLYTAFVTKLDPTGSTAIYSTYLGGSQYDVAEALAVDPAGNAYVVGYTTSGDFPVTAGAFQTICGANWQFGSGGTITRINGCGANVMTSGFLTKIDPTGSQLLYSTFLGGDVNDFIYAVAVDTKGQAYVGGYSGDHCDLSSQPAYACFPTTANALIQGTATNGYFTGMAFVSVFDAAGANLLYSTYIGDTAPTFASFGGTDTTAVAVDAAGNFYVTGSTISQHLPTTSGSFQPVKPSFVNSPAGYVAKFGPVANGAVLTYATYLQPTGDTLEVLPSAITADGTGSAYVTGFTQSPSFPVTTGAYQTSCGMGGGNQCNSGFITKIKPDGSGLAWSTLLGFQGTSGGSVINIGNIQLDSLGYVYVAGEASAGFPLVNPIEPPVAGSFGQAFISKFDPTGSNLVFSTMVGPGGNTYQWAAGLAVDTQENIYLAGNTNAGGLATTLGAFQQSYGGGVQDGFIAKINPFVSTSTALLISPNAAAVGTPVTLTATVTATNAGAASGTVTFYNGPASLGTAPLASGSATLTSSTLAAGVYSVTAQYSGDGTYAASTSLAQSLALQATQTITFTGTPASAAFASTFPVSATASSGLAVTITPSGVCTLSGNTVTMTSGTGACTLTASQPGNASYTAAANVVNVVTAHPATQTITFNAIAAQTTGASIPLVAAATSGLPVSFASSTPTICTVSGTTASTILGGTCTIQASQTGNTSYAPATNVSQSFAVTSTSTAGFTITPLPPQETVFAGDVAAFLLRVQSLQGFNGNVKLSCSGGPAGSACGDFPMTLRVNGTAFALSGILFPKNSKPGSYTITFTGVSGIMTSTAKATFTVK